MFPIMDSGELLRAAVGHRYGYAHVTDVCEIVTCIGVIVEWVATNALFNDIQYLNRP